MTEETEDIEWFVGFDWASDPPLDLDLALPALPVVGRNFVDLSRRNLRDHNGAYVGGTLFALGTSRGITFDRSILVRESVRRESFPLHLRPMPRAPFCAGPLGIRRPDVLYRRGYC